MPVDPCLCIVVLLDLGMGRGDEDVAVAAVAAADETVAETVETASSLVAVNDAIVRH